MKNIEKIKNNFLEKENSLSEYATKSSDAIRFQNQKEDIRPSFFRDVDRILHSLSYTRYDNKTQVYSFKANDHISVRMVHVQLVSKIARTIGRALRLNEDLIEAIALCHDIGHTPLGHSGEAMLNGISLRVLGEAFAHNVQGVRNFMYVDNHGLGLNLTVQTLDGVLCHNGEMLSPKYVPMQKDEKEFLREYQEAYYDLKKSKKYSPMTLEGCVVRISDIIAYIGRDIEDAIQLGLFQRDALPTDITSILGNTNKEIVNTIILDIIEHSLDKPYLEMSPEVYHALMKLKKFNHKEIYSKSLTKEEYAYYEKGMNHIFDVYVKALEEKDYQNVIYEIFLNGQSSDYKKNTSNERIVIDFISGMTDEFFLNQILLYQEKEN